ncbi:MAG: cardiolipin synthase B, partial [Polaromonas sp.]|nr:cardiolipin synthase B [Polaromonas sp.]
MHFKRRPLFIALITFVLTATALLLALNFTAGEKQVKQQLPRLYGTSDPQFMRAMGSLLGPGIAGGNQVSELLNGDQIFPSMLEAIRGAKRTITFETYIYWSGDIGKQFADA